MPQLKPGDAVCINYRQITPNALVDIDGWQGRVIKITVTNNQQYAYVELDSITLRRLPERYIRHCLTNKTGFEFFSVPIEYCEPTALRDLPIDVSDAVTAIQRKYESPLDTLNNFLARVADDEDAN